jgi:hypothetical protein
MFKAECYVADIKVRFRTVDFPADAAGAIVEAIQGMGTIDGDGHAWYSSEVKVSEARWVHVEEAPVVKRAIKGDR